jgi:hypothetical protein
LGVTWKYAITLEFEDTQPGFSWGITYTTSCKKGSLEAFKTIKPVSFEAITKPKIAFF